MGLYIQYGCGPSCPDGWVNFDASPTLRLQKLPLVGGMFRRPPIIFSEKARYGDIVKGLPCPDESAEGIYASHVLEHLALADFWTALQNTFRLLKPGGIFRLVVPDLEIRARRYLQHLESGDPEASSWFMNATMLGVERRKPGLGALARTLFGNSAHLWMWDEKSMSAALQKVGFANVRRCALFDCRDPAFRAVEDPGRFHDEQYRLDECAMEAIRPAK